VTLNELGKEIIEINTANGWSVTTPEDWPLPPEQAMDGWKIEEPHIVETEDCMGQELRYWRVWANGPTGRNVAGCGPTAEHSLKAVRQAILDDPKSRYKIPAILALITSEASEALEAFRVGDKENFAEELADVVIRCLDCAAGLGIDMDDTLNRKLEKNRHRGYRHGGKKV
jgi:NTP pyrophosphatase (non-canonical NTP hydrolase)